jgi:hypothetical protein
MPFQVVWQDEARRILLMRGTNLVSWNEVYQSFDQAGALLEGIEHSVITLIVFDDFPKGLIMPNVRHIMRKTPETIVGSVIVLDYKRTTAKFIEMMIKAVRSVTGGTTPLEFASTLDDGVREAEKLLASYQQQTDASADG